MIQPSLSPPGTPNPPETGFFEVSEWDACVKRGGCPAASDSGFGRGTRPVINVSWDDAESYVAWLSQMTGRSYRLLSDAEWEYAARAGTTTAYYWGSDIGKNNADCDGCGSRWDNRETAPAGSFKPNAFGLYDMAGNVSQWVQDCYADTKGSCTLRVLRGGSWSDDPRSVRMAFRYLSSPGNRINYIGFRVARTIAP